MSENRLQPNLILSRAPRSCLASNGGRAARRYALITVMMVTGVILYLGYGGWWVWVHSISAFIGFGYIFFHVLTYYLFGRWVGVLPLVPPRAVGDHASDTPLSVADRRSGWHKIPARQNSTIRGH
jgi:hypothetical protein